MQSKLVFTSLVAALVAGAPLTGYSRDKHHDNHRHDRSSDHHGHGHYYSHGSYYGRGYYGGSYYRGGYGYGYRPYYYSRPYWGPSIGFSFYSHPTTVYRGYVADNGSLGAEVQRELRRRGYYYGPIDGAIGPQSRAAIRAYQAKRGLYITGSINQSLLRSLGIS